MAKQIKLKKSVYRKLAKTWPGLLVIFIVLGYNYYQANKPIEPGKRFEVTLNECVDGDTAWFNVNGKKQKVRFLFIDTPESTKEIEPFGIEASNYTKEALSNAKKIELELNKDGATNDKYDRLLAWVFVDGELLQEELAEQGLVEKFYDYGVDYTYKKEIVAADKTAQAKGLGIYSK